MRLRHSTHADLGRHGTSLAHDDTENALPETQAAITRLRAYGASVPRDPAFIARLRVELMVAHRQQRSDQPVWRPAHSRSAQMASRSRRVRARLASLGAVLALVVGSIVGYLRLQSPTAVSAQTILKRAAAVATGPQSAPNQVIHQVSTVSTVLKLNIDPLDTTVDQWIQLDDGGAIAQRIATIHSITGALVASFLDKGSTEQIYDAAGNTIFSDKLPAGATPWSRDPSGMAYARQMLLAAQHDNGQNARLLPDQTLDGVAVHVVAIDNLGPTTVPAVAGFTPQRLTTTLYIDAQSYAIHGMDLNEVAGNSSSPIIAMRVTRYETVPPAQVAADTFALGAPATAQVWHPGPVPPQVAQAHTLASSVAGAVAVAGQPALLLSGNIAGLRFHGVAADIQQDGITITDYSYGPPLRVADEGGGPVAADGIGGPSPTARSFNVQIDGVPASAAAGVPLGWGMRGEQAMTVTIAGQAVQAHYWVDTDAPAIHQLIYRQGASWIKLSSYGLSTDEFLSAIHALVDASANPDVVAQAQHELDVWNYEVHATLVATEGLCSACGS